MTKRNAELLLFAVIAVRSTAYLFSKVALESMGPYTLMSIRFILAFFILCVIFLKSLRTVSRKTLLRGSFLGVLFFLTMACELVGLTYIDSSTMGFLENMAIVFVPLLDALLLRKAPRPIAIITSVIAVIGVAFLTLKEGHLNLSIGELISLGAAFFYAITIIATDRLAKKDDAAVLGVIQIGVIGVLGTAAAFLLENPALPASGPVWANMMFLVIVCTVFGFTLQPVAQKYTSAETAGLFCAFNPLIAGILGITILHEHFGLNTLIGGILILSGIVISKLRTETGHESHAV